MHARKLLGWTASITSDSEVAATLTAATERDPQLLPVVLDGIAQWSEHVELAGGHSITGTTYRITDLPRWFPGDVFATLIRQSLPDVEPADEDDSERYSNDLHRLSSQVLWLVEGPRV